MFRWLWFTLLFGIIITVCILATNDDAMGAPNPDATKMELDEDLIHLGESVMCTLEGTNWGSSALEGYLIISFPDNPSASTISIVSGPSNSKVYKKGDYLSTDYGGIKEQAQYPSAQGYYTNWGNGRAYSLKVKFTPSAVGEYSVFFKLVMADSSYNWYADPHTDGSGKQGETITLDHQDEHVYEKTFSVSLPDPDITDYDFSYDTIYLGETVTIWLEGENDGGLAEEGDLVISFPGNPPDSSIKYLDGGPSKKIINKTRDTMYGYYGTRNDITAQYPSVSGVQTNWRGTASYKLTVKYTPTKIGTQTIYFKLTMGRAHGTWFGDPEESDRTKTKDHQGERVYEKDLTVILPIPDITDYGFDKPSIYLGETVTISLTGENDGGMAEEGDLGISFPGKPPTSSIKILDGDSISNVFYKINDPMSGGDYGRPSDLYAKYPAVLRVHTNWKGTASYTLKVEYTPITTGSHTIYFKLTMGRQGGLWFGDPPETDTRYVEDHQNERVYELSLVVTEPIPHIKHYGPVDDQIYLGETVVIYLEGENLGDTAQEGDLVIGFYDNPPASTIQIIPVGPSTRKKYEVGNKLNGNYGRDSSILAKYPTVMGIETQWKKASSYNLTIKFTPITIGSYTIYFKLTMGRSGGQWYGDPDEDDTRKTIDHQSERVYQKTLTVSQPVPRITDYGLVRPSIFIGDTVTIYITGVNDGGMAEEGDLVISFQGNPPVSSIKCQNSPIMEIINKTGDRMWGCYGRRNDLIAEYPSVSGIQTNWRGKDSFTLKVEYTPTTTGDHIIYFKLTMGRSGGKWYGFPKEDGTGSSTIMDHQKEYVLTKTLVVRPIPEITVSISAFPTSGFSPLEVTMEATVSGGTGPYTYSWTLGDGTTSEDASVTHTYSPLVESHYHVECIVTDAEGFIGSDEMDAIHVVIPEVRPDRILIQPMFEPMIVEDLAVLMTYWEVMDASQKRVNGVTVSFSPRPLPQSILTSKSHYGFDGTVVAMYDLATISSMEFIVSPVSGRRDGKDVDLVRAVDSIAFTIVDRRAEGSVTVYADLGAHMGVGFAVSPYAKLSIVGNGQSIDEIRYEVGGRAGVTMKATLFKGGIEGVVSTQVGVEGEIGLDVSRSLTLVDGSEEYQSEIFTALVTNALLIGFTQSILVHDAAAIVAPFIGHAISRTTLSISEIMDRADSSDYKVGLYMKGEGSVSLIKIGSKLKHRGTDYGLFMKLPTVSLTGSCSIELNPSLRFYKDGRTTLELYVSIKTGGSLELIALKAKGGFIGSLELAATWSSSGAMMDFLMGEWDDRTIPLYVDLAVHHEKGWSVDSVTLIDDAFNFNNVFMNIHLDKNQRASTFYHIPFNSDLLADLTEFRTHLLELNIIGAIEDLSKAICQDTFNSRKITYQVVKYEDDQFTLGFCCTVAGIGFEIGMGTKTTRSYVAEVGYLYGMKKFPVASYDDVPTTPSVAQYCKDHWDGGTAIQVVLDTVNIFNLACPADATITNPSGMRIGRTPEGWVNEIEGADYYIRDDLEHGSETYALPRDDKYNVIIKGTGEGTYNYSMLTYVDGEIRYIEIFRADITPEQQDKYIVDTNLSIVEYIPSDSKSIELKVEATVEGTVIQRQFQKIEVNNDTKYGIKQQDWVELERNDPVVIHEDKNNDGTWDTTKKPVLVVRPRFGISTTSHPNEGSLRIALFLLDNPPESLSYHVCIDDLGWRRIFPGDPGVLTIDISNLEEGSHKLRIRVDRSGIPSTTLTMFFTKGVKEEELSSSWFDEIRALAPLNGLGLVIVILSVIVVIATTRRSKDDVESVDGEERLINADKNGVTILNKPVNELIENDKEL